MHPILALADPMEHVLPYRYFGIPIHLFGHDWTFWVTNHIILMLIAALLMLWIFPTLFHDVQTDAPKGWKNFFEFVLEFLRDEVFRPVLKDYTDAFLPFLWTLFFFILFCNVLGLLPLAEIVEIITGGRVRHLGGAATGAITTTATLAFITFIMIHVNGVGVLYRSLTNGTYGHHGHGDAHHKDEEHAHGEKMPAAKALVMTVPIYLWNFAPHPFKDKGIIADAAMWIFLLVMELIGAVIKPFALCMRLFGNMVSGHLVLAVFAALVIAVPTLAGRIGVGIPIMILDLLIYLLEVLVAFLHAYIFAFLSAIFIAGAIAPEH